MPVRQLFPAANIKALSLDHSYRAVTMEEDFLQKVELCSISVDRVKEVERKTRGQASNATWFEERLKRITASHFGEICRATERRDKGKLASSLTSRKDISSASMRHGQKYESVAAEKAAAAFYLDATECGLFVCQKYPFLAASPDRVINDAAIMEVKCPFTAKDKMISPTTVPYLKPVQGSDTLVLDTNHVYYYQVQGQLLCSGRGMCYFVGHMWDVVPHHARGFMLDVVYVH